MRPSCLPGAWTRATMTMRRVLTGDPVHGAALDALAAVGHAVAPFACSATAGGNHAPSP